MTLRAAIGLRPGSRTASSRRRLRGKTCRSFPSFPRMELRHDVRMFAQIKSVHFVGVGGTAMAAVAAAMRDKGFTVTGSDQNVYPPMSTYLAAKQVEVMS